MPNRILRESICTSADVDSLSPEAEVFFYRLIVQADDFGRADGRAAILRARCFPLRLETVSEGDVWRWLRELEERGMVSRYQAGAHDYIELTAWSKYQRARAAASKFPDPPADDGKVRTDDSEPQASAAVVRSRSSVVENRESRSEKDTPAPDGAMETNGKGPKRFYLADVVNLNLVVTMQDRYRRRAAWKGVTPGLLTALVLGSEDRNIPAYGARAVNAAIDDLYENAAKVPNPAGYLRERAESHAAPLPDSSSSSEKGVRT